MNNNGCFNNNKYPKPSYTDYTQCENNKKVCDTGVDEFYRMAAEIKRLSNEIELTKEGTITSYLIEAIELAKKAVFIQSLGTDVRSRGLYLGDKLFDWYNNNIGCEECKKIESEVRRVLVDLVKLEDEGLKLIQEGIAKWEKSMEIKQQSLFKLEDKYIDCACKMVNNKYNEFGHNDCNYNYNCNCNYNCNNYKYN